MENKKELEEHISLLKKILTKELLIENNIRSFIKSMNFLSSNHFFKANFSNNEAKILFNYLKELKKDDINFLPESLLPYKSDILKNKREYVKINAIPLKTSIFEDTLEYKQSKFLGIPFLPKDVEYPKDNSGKYMLHLAQLNFEEIPNIKNFPKKGILQLYVSPDNWYTQEKGNYKILFFDEEQLNQEPLSDFSFITEQQFEYTPIYKIHKLNFEKSNDYGTPQDGQFNIKLNGMKLHHFAETLNDDDEGDLYSFFNSHQHMIGGYTSFVNSDPREIDNSGIFNDDVQLLQINVDEYIIFGDTGIVHVFIP